MASIMDLEPQYFQGIGGINCDTHIVISLDEAKEWKCLFQLQILKADSMVCTHQNSMMGGQSPENYLQSLVSKQKSCSFNDFWFIATPSDTVPYIVLQISEKRITTIRDAALKHLSRVLVGIVLDYSILVS